MLKKTICILLPFLMIFSLSATTFAAKNEVSSNNTILELEQFLDLTEQGTITFDIASALQAGYDSEMINAVNAHISNMNA